MKVSSLYAATGFLILLVWDLHAADRIDAIKFSSSEIVLLKRVNQIQVGAGISSTMLKVAPFVQLLSSPSPLDVAITIKTNDWDQIFSSLQGLQKIQACKTVEEIDLWKDVDGNNYSSAKTERSFASFERGRMRGVPKFLKSTRAIVS